MLRTPLPVLLADVHNINACAFECMFPHRKYVLQKHIQHALVPAFVILS